jgi:hypothetical protein
MVVLGPEPPEVLPEESRWKLQELRWVYVRLGDMGEPYWMLLRV